MVAYITKNISLAMRDISEPGPVSSSSEISALGARRAGCGYLSTRRSVPSTTPGSTSSVVLNRELVHDDEEEEEDGRTDSDVDG